MVWSGAYDAFGNCEAGVETVVSNLRLPGQYYDEETGLYYNLNRYYDPKTGRYLQPDPAGDGLNPYLYAGANPVNAIDPNGLCAIRQFALGDFTESVNLLGTALSIGFSLTGLDAPFDIRDFFANVYHGKWGWAAMNLAAVLPVVGVLKYADEVAEVTDVAKKLKREDIIKRLGDVLEGYLPEIRRIAPDAHVGFRGSLARGFKGKHKKYAPFDPTDFDIDIFVASDVLRRGRGFQVGPKPLRNLAKKIDSELRLLPEFKGLRSGKDKLQFRIWGQKEISNYK